MVDVAKTILSPDGPHKGGQTEDSGDFELGPSATNTELNQPIFIPTYSGWQPGKEIGTGGFGSVCTTRPAGLPTEHGTEHSFYVIKTLQKRSQEATDRFNREMLILQLLDGKGFPFFIQEVQDPSGNPAFVMQHIKGQTMDTLDRLAQDLTTADLQAASQSTKSLIESLIRVCECVQGAHLKGIIHRDLKPANIMIDGPNVCVLDVGLAKFVQTTNTVADTVTSSNEAGTSANNEDASKQGFVTRAGEAPGTPLWMAPEQLTAPHTVDFRTDIFQLGAILYQMICGEAPVVHQQQKPTDHTEWILRISEANFRPPAPRCHLRGAHELQQIALKAINKDPDSRYQNLEEFIADLKAWQTQTEVAAYRESLPPLTRLGYRFGHWLAKHPRLDTLVKSGALVLGLGSLGFLAYRSEQAHALALANQQVTSIGTQTDQALQNLVQNLATHLRPKNKESANTSNQEDPLRDLVHQIRALPAEQLDDSAMEMYPQITNCRQELISALRNTPDISDAAQRLRESLNTNLKNLGDLETELRKRLVARQSALDQYTKFLKVAQGPIAAQSYQAGITFSLNKQPGGHIPVTAPFALIPELAPIAAAASRDKLKPGYFDCTGIVAEFIERIQEDLTIGSISPDEAKKYFESVQRLLEGWLTCRLHRSDYRWTSTTITPEDAESLGGVVRALQRVIAANSNQSSYATTCLELLYFDALGRTTSDQSIQINAISARDALRMKLKEWDGRIEAALRNSSSSDSNAGTDQVTPDLPLGSEGTQSVPDTATTDDILAYVNARILEKTLPNIEKALEALRWLNADPRRLEEGQRFRAAVLGGILYRMRFNMLGHVEDLERSSQSLAVAGSLITEVMEQSTENNRPALTQIRYFVDATALVARIKEAQLLSPPYRGQVLEDCTERMLQLPPTFAGLQALMPLVRPDQFKNYAAHLYELEPDQRGFYIRCLIERAARDGEAQEAVNRALELLNLQAENTNQTNTQDLFISAVRLHDILKQLTSPEDGEDRDYIAEIIQALLTAAQETRGPSDEESPFDVLGYPRSEFANLEQQYPDASKILNDLSQPLNSAI